MSSLYTSTSGVASTARVALGDGRTVAIWGIPESFPNSRKSTDREGIMVVPSRSLVLSLVMYIVLCVLAIVCEEKST